MPIGQKQLSYFIEKKKKKEPLGIGGITFR